MVPGPGPDAREPMEGRRPFQRPQGKTFADGSYHHLICGRLRGCYWRVRRSRQMRRGAHGGFPSRSLWVHHALDWISRLTPLSDDDQGQPQQATAHCVPRPRQSCRRCWSVVLGHAAAY
jgi:hypothetical protein